jgi:hypothetical protein
LNQRVKTQKSQNWCRVRETDGVYRGFERNGDRWGAESLGSRLLVPFAYHACTMRARRKEREERVKTTQSERISERESSSRRSLVFGAGVPIIFKPLPHTKTLTFHISLLHVRLILCLRITDNSCVKSSTPSLSSSSSSSPLSQ